MVIINDKKILIEIITANGLNLFFASDKLKNDKEVVLQAVNKNGMALQYASEDMKNDKEVIITAIKQDQNAFKYMSKKLKNNIDFLVELYFMFPRLYELKYIKENDSFWIKVLKKNKSYVKKLPKYLKDDKNFMDCFRKT